MDLGTENGRWYEALYGKQQESTNNSKTKPMSNTKSLGEQRVRVDFNVSGNSKVDEIKRAGADFINLVQYIGFSSDGTNSEHNRQNQIEYFRLKALAMTAIEEGTMWATKLATI